MTSFFSDSNPHNARQPLPRVVPAVPPVPGAGGGQGGAPQISDISVWKHTPVAREDGAQGGGEEGGAAQLRVPHHQVDQVVQSRPGYSQQKYSNKISLL